MLTKRVAIIIVGIAALLGIVMGVGVIFLLLSSPGRSPAQPMSTVVIIHKVQTLAELVTVKYVMEQVIPYEPASDSDWAAVLDRFSIGKSKLVLLAHGEVRAGVDFSLLRTNDIAVSDHRIRIILPPARITDAHLVESRTQVLDWQQGLFRGFDKNLAQKARYEALIRIKDAARQGGIEREAAERARVQLTTFLRALGFEEVDVQVREE